MCRLKGGGGCGVLKMTKIPKDEILPYLYDDASQKNVLIRLSDLSSLFIFL